MSRYNTVGDWRGRGMVDNEAAWPAPGRVGWFFDKFTQSKRRTSAWYGAEAARLALKVSTAPLHAVRRKVTTGRCFRPPGKLTSSTSRTPGLPRMSAHGLAHGEPRGQRARGS